MSFIEKKESKFKKVLTYILGVVQFIIVFILIFFVVSMLLFGPKTTIEKLGETSTALFKKVDTEVPIDNNTIIDEENEKLKKEKEQKRKAENVKTIDIDIPYDEQLLPKFDEEKYTKAAKLYSESEVKGLSNTWYYNQLDEYGKKIYLKLKNESAYFLEGQHTFNFGHAFNDLLNTPNGGAVLEAAFQQSVNALMFDFPELFFVNVRNISIQIQKTTYFTNKTIYSVTIGNSANKTFYVDELETKQEVEQAREILEKIRYGVMERVQNPSDPYEMVKTAHDYIVDTVDYDRTLYEPNIYNMYGALVNKKAVCEGYAKSMKYFLDYYGIPNIIVAGKGRHDNGQVERHAWNYVNIDGNWYGVDPTWDDPVILGDSSNVNLNRFKYRYFLKGQRSFSASHIPDGEIVEDFGFEYPELSLNDFGM